MLSMLILLGLFSYVGESKFVGESEKNALPSEKNGKNIRYPVSNESSMKFLT